MQCPSCNLEAPQAEFGEPLRCPSCGAFYAKALAIKQRQDAENAQRIQSAAEQAKVVKKAEQKTGGIRLMADHVAVSTRGLEGVQPVVVVDIQMRFWSMMVFMVKWMLAAIPAVIIFCAIIAIIGGVFGSFLTIPISEK